MKNRILTFIFAITIIISAFAFYGCKNKPASCKATLIYSDASLVIILVTETEGDATLKHAMDCVIGENFCYSAEGTMLTNINNVANSQNNYWLIYTTDKTFSNSAWGTFNYDEKEFFSAIFGFSEQPIKSGNYYAFKYTSF